ncbi:phage tail protein [Burkholderia gladioli]|uniref:phage tail protein n=1 Tax=Burkholderia gladioli TaxID=28095 RepID=UPI0034DB4A8E
MNKVNSLRAAIVAAVPELARAPDRLLVFVNEGTVCATGTRTTSFDCEYECELIITRFTGHAIVVMAAVIEWAKLNEPALVENPDLRRGGIAFEADIQSNEATDIVLKLKLSESVVVKVDDDGRRLVEYFDEAAEPWQP